MMRWLRWGVLVSLILGLGVASRAAPGTVEPVENGFPLTLLPGADGPAETVNEDGKPAVRGVKDDKGNYPAYLYFRVPDRARRLGGGPVYLQVDYKDVGPGPLGVQYNAAGEGYRSAARGYGRLMTGSGAYRTAVFELPDPAFRGAQNLGADLRLVGPGGKTPLHIVSARLYARPTPLFRARSARPWLLPYAGPRRNDVDASTLKGKVLCGYQGWFHAPGDPTERGWVHWSRDSGRIAPETLTVEMWPDMTEYKRQYPAGAFRYPDGKPATLFSSADPETVDLHFDWMDRYGIDGVFVQRFLGGLEDAAEASRVIGHVRQAAARTGRVFALEFDMSGTPPEQGLPRMQAYWRYLVDELKITEDPRYLKHDGRPVLAVWGFYTDRFSGAWANRIIDAFKAPGKYQVTLVGGGQWHWRTERDPEWARAFRRFDVIKPWSVGNLDVRGGVKRAQTNYWADDLAEAKRNNMLYLPVIYPGFSWDNLQKTAPGTSLISRRGGDFFWEQFTTAQRLGIDTAFVAMFDEVDEGTAIFKVTHTPPTGAHFVTLDGKPSDWYLRLTGKGTQLLRGAAKAPPNER
uniref:GH99 n=1 Tax=uncultured Armatimonadetes bacterium TaxID=157466 RepID=A0A6J4I882_9BACT|nr:GH99 [uncultured Armatimonadetes bacterium]